MRLLGAVEPDPIGQMLGTGYMRFQSPDGLGGLAKWSTDRLNLLAVHASVPGKGQFRDFIAKAKLEWKTICVWEDWNPLVGQALARYGFQRETEIQGDGECSLAGDGIRHLTRELTHPRPTTNELYETFSKN